MIVWRLCRVIYRDLSGAGGLRYHGRWNEAGLPIVYSSGSLALSVLERRVHSAQQPRDDVAIEIQIPDASIEKVGTLPDQWKSDFQLTRTLGTQWLISQRSLCLQVPSALVPDFNYLINPRHPGIDLVKVISVRPFQYDPRLFQSSAAE